LGDSWMCRLQLRSSIPHGYLPWKGVSSQLHLATAGARDASGPAPISSKIFPGGLPGTPGCLGFPGALQRLPTKHNSDDKAELLFVQHARSATLRYTEVSETEKRGELVMEGVSPRYTSLILQFKVQTLLYLGNSLCTAQVAFMVADLQLFCMMFVTNILIVRYNNTAKMRRFSK
jgi:hypothetical protein